MIAKHIDRFPLLKQEVLITYPVERQRLDIYTRFLAPAGVQPLRHKAVENTDIMLQMVASGRGVTALPRWLAQEYARKLPLATVRLGPRGIAKQIHLGARKADLDTAYLRAFIEQARAMSKELPQKLPQEPPLHPL